MPTDTDDEVSSELVVQEDVLPAWALAGESYTAALGYIDAPVRFTLHTAPAGMALEPTTGELVWSPTRSDVGRHLVEAVVEQQGEAREVRFSVRAFGAAPLVEQSMSAAAGGDMHAVLAESPEGPIEVTVVVPPAALAEDTVMGIHKLAPDFPTDDPITAHVRAELGFPPSERGHLFGFQLSPGGVVFDAPVEVEVALPRAHVGAARVLNGVGIEHLSAGPGDLLRWFPEASITVPEASDPERVTVRYTLGSFSANRVVTGRVPVPVESNADETTPEMLAGTTQPGERTAVPLRVLADLFPERPTGRCLKDLGLERIQRGGPFDELDVRVHFIHPDDASWECLHNAVGCYQELSLPFVDNKLFLVAGSRNVHDIAITMAHETFHMLDNVEWYSGLTNQGVFDREYKAFYAAPNVVAELPRGASRSDRGERLVERLALGTFASWLIQIYGLDEEDVDRSPDHLQALKDEVRALLQCVTAHGIRRHSAQAA